MFFGLELLCVPLFGLISVLCCCWCYYIPWLCASRGRIKNLKKKYKTEWALITGASDGCGKALAIEMAKIGFNVVLHGRKEWKLDEVIKGLTKNFPQQEFKKIVSDVAKEDFLDDFDAVCKDMDIGFVFNNAGMVLRLKKFHELPLDSIMKIINVNTIAYVKLTHYFLNKWVDAKRDAAFMGFHCSMAGVHPFPLNTAYGAGKRFIQYMCESLYMECKDYGFDFCAINSEVIDTNITKGLPEASDDFREGVGATKPQAWAKKFLKVLPRTVVYDSTFGTVFLRLLYSCSFGKSANFMAGPLMNMVEGNLKPKEELEEIFEKTKDKVDGFLDETEERRRLGLLEDV